MQEPRAEASILRGSITGQHLVFIHCPVLDKKVRNEEPDTIKVRFHPAPFTTHRIGRSRFCGPYQLGIGTRRSKEQGQMVEGVLVPCIVAPRRREHWNGILVDAFARLSPKRQSGSPIEGLWMISGISMTRIRFSSSVFESPPSTAGVGGQ